jgi:outer membrane protein TolC
MMPKGKQCTPSCSGGHTIGGARRASPLTQAALLASVVLVTAPQATAQAPSARPQAVEAPVVPGAAAATPGEAASQAAVTTSAPTAPGSAALEARLAELVGQPFGLTSDQAAKRGALASRGAEAASQDVLAADATVNEVLADGLPRLDLLGRYTRLSRVEPDPSIPFSFPIFLNQYQLQAGLRVPLTKYLLSIGAAYRAAQSSKRQAQLSVEAERLKGAIAARSSYYIWVRASLQKVVLEQAVEEARATVVRTERATNAGRGTVADITSAKARLAYAELDLERARAQVTLEHEKLRLLLKDAKGTSYRIGERILEEPARAALGDGATLEALVAEAKRQRREARAYEEASNAVRQSTAVVRARQAPQLEAFGNGYYARPNQRLIPPEDRWAASWDVGVQLSWSPNDFGIQGAQAAKQEVALRKLELERQAFLESLEVEVLESHTAMKQSALAVSTAEQALEAAELSARTQRVLFDNGRSTTLELVQAEGEVLRARTALIDAHVGLRLNRALLEHALGRK